MLRTLLRTVQPEEIVWTTAVIVGLVLNRRNYHDAIADEEARLEKGVNGQFRVLTDWALRDVRAHLRIKLLMLVVGAIALTREPSPYGNVWTRVITSGIFIFIVIQLDYLAWKIKEDRQMLRDYETYSGPERREKYLSGRKRRRERA